MTDDAVRTIHTDQGYTISYAGGRLADVLIDGVAVECVSVREYFVAHGTFGRVPTDDEIRRAVRDFINPDDMDNYRDMARAHRGVSG